MRDATPRDNAYNAFLEAQQGPLAHGTLEDQLTEMRAALTRLETTVRVHGEQIRALAIAVRALRQPS